MAFSPSRVVIVAEGERYSSFAMNAVMSSLRHLPESVVVDLICRRSEPYLVPLLKATGRVRIFPIDDYMSHNYRSAVSFSKILWIKHFLYHVPEGEMCLFLDADAMLISNPYPMIPKDLELGITVRETGYPINLGVLFVRKNARTTDFLTRMLREIEKMLDETPGVQDRAIMKHGALDQHALAMALIELYKPHPESGLGMLKIEKLDPFDSKHPIITVLNCREFNHVDSLEPTDSKLPMILHLKASIRLYIETKGVNNSARYGHTARYTREVFESSLQSGLSELMATIQRSSDFQARNETKLRVQMRNEKAEPRGIWPSEAIQMAKVFASLQVPTIIESGRARAEATYWLSRLLPSIEIISIDSDFSSDDAVFGKARLEGIPNVKILDGKAERLMASEIGKRTDNVGLFIDGPKGKEAIRLAKKLVKSHANISVIAFHDMHSKFLGKSNASRHELDNSFDLVWFGSEVSEDSQHQMDEKTSFSTKWKSLGKGSPSPTVAFVFPTWRDRLHQKKRFVLRKLALELLNLLNINPKAPVILTRVYSALINRSTEKF